MKRFLIASFAMLVSMGGLAAIANASQVVPGHGAADLNGDGNVSLTEVKNYNRDQRQN